MKLQLGREAIRGDVALLLLLLCGLGASSTRIMAQSQAPPKSPKDVLQAYRKLEAAGERTTANGWYRTSAFFVKPSPPPALKAIEVISEELVDDPDPWFKGGKNKVQIAVICTAFGQIDALGRFTFTVFPYLIDRSGRPVKEPVRVPSDRPHLVNINYQLVLTDTHWEFGVRGEGLREIKGPPEWRIETFQFHQWITIDAAIRYLTTLRKESSSEVIRNNAEKSIATLRHLKLDPGFQQMR